MDAEPRSDLGRLADAAGRIADLLGRLADEPAPAPSDLVDTVCVARELVCGTTWVGEMAREGRTPKSCVVAGTGNSKLWRSYRHRIDEWIERR